jgi:hypothetical protein
LSNFATQRGFVPAGAHRPPDNPGPDADYSTYRRIGRIRATAEDTRTASEVERFARIKFHTKARVFRTARWWVVYLP